MAKAQTPVREARTESPAPAVVRPKATVNDAHIYRPPWETGTPQAKDSPEPDSVEEQPEQVESAVEETEAVEAEGVESESVEAASDEPELEAVSDDEELQAESVEPEQPEATTRDEEKADRLRQADYTRKTQELSAKEKALAADFAQKEAEIARRSAEYGEKLAALQAALTEKLPQEPNRTEYTDPVAYLEAVAEYDKAQRQLQGVRQQQNQWHAEQQKHFHNMKEAYKTEQASKLFEAIPDLKDETKALALVTYAKTSFGMTDAEIEDTLDHRIWVLADKARKWDELQSKAKEIPAKVKPTAVLRPGGAKAAPRGGQAELKALEDKARRTGSPRDVEALYIKQQELRRSA